MICLCVSFVAGSVIDTIVIIIVVSAAVAILIAEKRDHFNVFVFLPPLSRQICC